MSGIQSLKNQNILMTKLGEQAIEALVILLQAFDRSNAHSDTKLEEIYEGLSLLLLAKIFELYTKERELSLLEKESFFSLPVFSTDLDKRQKQILGELHWISPEHYQKINSCLKQIEAANIDYSK